MSQKVKKVKLKLDERECLKCRKVIKKEKGWLCGRCRSSNDNIRSGRVPMLHFFGNDSTPTEDAEF